MAANGPIWMPQALKIICLAQVGWNPFFHFHHSFLWGNKNWPPSMKVKKLKNLRNKIGANGCKCSNLNAPGTQNLLPGSGWVKSIFPFSAFLSINCWPLISDRGRAREKPCAEHHSVRSAPSDGFLRGRGAWWRGQDQSDCRPAPSSWDTGKEASKIPRLHLDRICEILETHLWEIFLIWSKTNILSSIYQQFSKMVDSVYTCTCCECCP